jgi:hypothetical protein
MTISRAPWTEDQVKQLKGRQTTGHPYTCGSYCEDTSLEPTTEGWICPTCDYIQDWCHEPDVSQVSLDFYHVELDDGTVVDFNITEKTGSAYIIILKPDDPLATPNVLQTIEDGNHKTMLRLPLNVLFAIMDMAANYDLLKLQDR